MISQEKKDQYIEEWLQADLNDEHDFAMFALSVKGTHDQRIVDRLKRYDIRPVTWAFYVVNYLDRADWISPEDARALCEIAVAHQNECDSMYDYHLHKTKVMHIMEVAEKLKQEDAQ